MNGFTVARTVAIAAVSVLAIGSKSALALSFTAIEAGRYSSCGISPEQELWCWGSNLFGVLGVQGGSQNQDPGLIAMVPRRVELEDVTAVSIGSDHVCAIAGGQAWCWGHQQYGQLGVGLEYGQLAAAFRPLPVGGVLAGRTDVTAISAGYSTTCAIAGGQLYCWGRGDHGQIGNGSNEESVRLPSELEINGATAVAVGEGFACAIAQDLAWCWGYGGSGALGYGSNDSSMVPVAVSGLPGGVPLDRLAVGMAHACVIAAGRVWCWGQGDFGQLGTSGYGSSNVAVPVMWNQESAFIDIDAGYDHTCGIEVEGRAWCWGSDAWGGLGNDILLEPKYVPTPVYPPFASNVTALSAGIWSSCGVAGGIAHCWGRNGYAQLGIGTITEFVQLPVPVDMDRIFDSGFDS